MFGTVDKLVEIYQVEIISKTSGAAFQIDCINAEHPLIMQLPNPQIKRVKEQQLCMRRLVFTEEDSTDEYLPVHLLLGQRFQKNQAAGSPIDWAQTP
jgi:hypothetical protein